MSTFGRVFRVTTFGESHCKGVGAVVDGVPPCMELTEADIQPQLTRRRPGQSKLTTPRDEKDQVSILSGTEMGRTLGTPIGLFVPNQNVRPKDYKEMAQVPRPGHADYTYQIKYGTRASSGGGRSSARETIGRVAAGAIAEKWLRQQFNTEITAFVCAIGTVEMPAEHFKHPSGRAWTRHEIDELGKLIFLRHPQKGWRRVTEQEIADEKERAAEQKKLDLAYEEYFVPATGDLSSPAYMDMAGKVYNREGSVVAPPSDLSDWKTDDVVVVRCPHAPSACKMSTLIREVKLANDSTGGVVAGVITNMPIGVGEPCFDKFEAMMAHAMLSLPATKGFEFGSGFAGTRERGSSHNDPFQARSADRVSTFLRTSSNNAGGTLGGITNGSDFTYKVAVKAVSTIGRPQQTATFSGEAATLEAKGRHDPCVLPRAPPLLEGMAALVVADAAMIQATRVGSAGPVCSFVTEERHRAVWNEAQAASDGSAAATNGSSTKRARTGS